METQLCNQLVLLLCEPRVRVADAGSVMEEFPEWEIGKSRDEWRNSFFSWCSFLPCPCVIAALLLISSINQEKEMDFYSRAVDLQIGDVRSGEEQFQVIPLWFSSLRIQDDILHLKSTLDPRCLEIHITREK